MEFPALRKSLRNLLVLACGGLAFVLPVAAQTVRVDVTALKAIPFDPDKAMGTSLDILPAKDFDKVFSEPIIKESLSAGWGPITYRQNTELTYDAWHWNPDGTWSDEKHKSGYFEGSAEPKDFLRESFGYRVAHRGTTRSDSGQFEYSRMTDGDPATLLEEQSLSGIEIHGRSGFRESAVGGDRFCVCRRTSMQSRLPGPIRMRRNMWWSTGREEKMR